MRVKAIMIWELKQLWIVKAIMIWELKQLCMRVKAIMNMRVKAIIIWELKQLCSFRERARTHAPTTRNCTVELPTFAVIAGVSPGEVQYKSLTLEEAPSWSGLLPRLVIIRRFLNFPPIPQIRSAERIRGIYGNF